VTKLTGKPISETDGAHRIASVFRKIEVEK